VERSQDSLMEMSATTCLPTVDRWHWWGKVEVVCSCERDGPGCWLRCVDGQEPTEEGREQVGDGDADTAGG
jgi:hypothetical protein